MITEEEMIEFANEDEDENYDKNIADMEEAIFPQENQRTQRPLSMWEEVYAYLDTLDIEDRYTMCEKIESIEMPCPTTFDIQSRHRPYNNYITITPRRTIFFLIH